MTFGSSDNITTETLAHEGSHAGDRQDYFAALMDANNKNPSMTDEDGRNLRENLTKYATENSAYHATSYIQEFTNTPGQFWNKGWKEADRQKAIDSHLKSSSLYKGYT